MSNGTDDRKATFARNLAALNSQFASWVAEQSSSAPKELWTDGVEDYLKYAKQLLADFKDVLDGSGSKAEPAAAAAAAAAAGSSKPPLAPGGLFGAASSQGGGLGAASAPSSIFGALPSTGGAFGLGASGAGAFGGFGGSGAGSAANSGGSGLFNVPSTGTLGATSISNTAADEGDEGEEGEEEQNTEPSVQLEAGEGTEMLAKHRVKLMSMVDKKWKDKGQGTLTLRRATGDAGKQPYFVFTTDSGRVLINAPLVKGMKPTMNPKAPSSLIMFLISSVDGKEERGMHLFRCESADVAKQLQKVISEHA